MSDEVRDNTYRHRAKRLVIRNRGQDGWLLTVWDAEAIDTSHIGFPANLENCYHPRQFRVHSGNPD